MVELFGQPLSLLLAVAGAALMVAEALAPGAHFIVLGVALLVAGLVGLALGPALGPFTPLVLAGVVLLTGAGSLYVYRQFDFYGGKGQGQTSDSSSLRGQTGRVTERVTDSSGEVRLRDGGFSPVYRARSLADDIPEGTEVVVVDPGGGNVLTVTALDDVEDDIDRQLAMGREREETERESEDDTGAETA